MFVIQIFALFVDLAFYCNTNGCETKAQFLLVHKFTIAITISCDCYINGL